MSKVSLQKNLWTVLGTQIFGFLSCGQIPFGEAINNILSSEISSIVFSSSRSFICFVTHSNILGYQNIKLVTFAAPKFSLSALAVPLLCKTPVMDVLCDHASIMMFSGRRSVCYCQLMEVWGGSQGLNHYIRGGIQMCSAGIVKNKKKIVL